MKIRRMERQHNGRMGARHLSQIREESTSREHSGFLYPIVQQQTGGVEVEKQEVRELADPESLALHDQQKKLEDNKSLLEELTHIEAELQESLRLDKEKQQEDEFLRQQENKLLWQNLCYLSLSQQISKPWVSSYFRSFPMHIYCLPVQNVPRARRRSPKKSR